MVQLHQDPDFARVATSFHQRLPLYTKHETENHEKKQFEIFTKSKGTFITLLLRLRKSSLGVGF